MPNPLETSFIPQQPLLKAEGSAVRREPLNFPMIIGLIIFFVTLILGGGMYFWKKQVTEQVAAKKLALQESEKQFSIEEVRSFERLQVALNTAKKLVDEHTIFSVVFDLIERRVAKNIGLTELHYSTTPEKGVVVSLSGQAPSYGALYFQVGEWKKTPTVTKVDLKSFTLDEASGVVEFIAELYITPTSLHSAEVILAKQKAEQVAADAAALNSTELAPEMPANVIPQ